MVAEPGMVEVSGACMQVVSAEAKLLPDHRERSRPNYSSFDFFRRSGAVGRLELIRLSYAAVEALEYFAQVTITDLACTVETDAQHTLFVLASTQW